MNAGHAADTMWLLGALVLTGSALIARRLSAQRLLWLALIWASIFVAAVALVRVIGLVA